MSSYSTSRTDNTANSPTVQDNENPLTITGSSGTLLGDTNLGVYGTNNKFSVGELSVLDGGAIEGAFNFAGTSVGKVLDLAAMAFNAASSSQNNALDFAQSQSALAAESINAEGQTEKQVNKTLMIAGAVVALFLLVKYRWGK